VEGIRTGAVIIATCCVLTVRGSKLDGGEIYCAHLDRPRGLPSLLYNGYRVFPGCKAAGAWCWPPNSV